MPDLTLTQGDLLPSVRAAFTDALGHPVDLNGAAVVFKMGRAGGGLVVNNPAPVLDGPGGIAEYRWAGGETDHPGDFVARFIATWSDGRPLSFPNDKHLTVRVLRDPFAPGPPPPAGFTIVTVDELLASGDYGDVTDEQRDALQIHLEGLTARLEARLGRSLRPVEHRELVQVAPNGMPLFTHTPVIAVLEVAPPRPLWGRLQGVSATVAGPASADITLPAPADVPGLPPGWAVPGLQLWVRYTAGLDGVNLPAVKALLIRKAQGFAGSLLTAEEQGTGQPAAGALTVPKPPEGIQSFSVEGLHVQYEQRARLQLAAVQAAKETAALADFSDADLRDLGIYRRVVVA